ncbi:MAG: hypothetical protein ACYS47_13380 [Planctomycetota bacterium]|jgi:hypothetical protein
MVRFFPLALFLVTAASAAARSGPSLGGDRLALRPSTQRTRIVVLPGEVQDPSPDLLVSPSTDLWFSEGRKAAEPGISIAWDGFLHEGPVRLTLFFDGGFIFRRRAWSEERTRDVDVGGEILTFVETFHVEEESFVPGGIFGLGLAYEGGFGAEGFFLGSVGLGGAVTGPHWGGGVRATFSAGWRTGPWFVGFRLGGDARWTGKARARLTLGITGGLAF